MSTRNPTMKRILKEASEMSSNPSPDFTASPLESNLFEWHFTLTGPPAPSPFAGGIYHGRIVLPPAYPLRPPSFRFLTPSGRFEVNREICLSISGFHEESWQPAWGIRTALVAIRSFMDSEAGGQVGGMTSSEEVRRRLAGESNAFRCPGCGKRNEEVMDEVRRAVRELGAEGAEGTKELVPEELRLGYKDELEGRKEEQASTQAVPTSMPVAGSAESAAKSSAASTENVTSPAAAVSPVTSQARQTQPVPSTPQSTAQQQRPAAMATQVRPQPADADPWLDKAIIGVAAALALVVLKVLFA